MRAPPQLALIDGEIRLLDHLVTHIGKSQRQTKTLSHYLDVRHCTPARDPILNLMPVLCSCGGNHRVEQVPQSPQVLLCTKIRLLLYGDYRRRQDLAPADRHCR